MEVLDASAVVCEIHVRASPETIYEYFVDPVKMLQWKGVEAELTPEPGGVYRVNVTGREIASGRYVELVPPTRVVFTWGWESEGNPVPPGSSVIEIDLLPDEHGTLVRLTHRDLPTEVREAPTTGWAHYLDRLCAASEGRDLGPDSWVGAEIA